MVTIKQVAIEKLSLYFFLTFSDEQKAEKAIQSVWNELNAKTLNWKTRSKTWQKLLIQVADRSYEKQLGYQAIQRTGVFQSAIENTINISWAKWREFSNRASKNELSAVLWVKILDFPIEVVAESLGVSVSTLRYRLNHGLIKLGQCIGGKDV